MDHYEDTKSIAERVKQFPWFHSIDLGNGIVTPGSKSPEIHAQEAAAFFDPIRMEGTSVVDVGAWNGFTASRRSVVARSGCWQRIAIAGSTSNSAGARRSI